MLSFWALILWTRPASATEEHERSASVWMMTTLTPEAQLSSWPQPVASGPVQSLQSCPAPGNTMDRSPPGSSFSGILQARILEWGAMPSSKDLPDPGNQPASQVSCIGRGVLCYLRHPGNPQPTAEALQPRTQSQQQQLYLYLLETHVSRLHLRAINWETLGLGSHGLFNKLLRVTLILTLESVRLRSWNFCQAESGHKALSATGCDFAAGGTGGRVRVICRYVVQRPLPTMMH